MRLFSKKKERKSSISNKTYVPENWSFVNFAFISARLQEECIVLNFVCRQFSVYLHSDEYWVFLLSLLKSDPIFSSSISLVWTADELRQQFLSQVRFHWDPYCIELYLSGGKSRSPYMALDETKRVCTELRGCDIYRNSTTPSFMMIRTREPVPSHTGGFWTFAIHHPAKRNAAKLVSIGLLPKKRGDPYCSLARWYDSSTVYDMYLGSGVPCLLLKRDSPKYEGLIVLCGYVKKDELILEFFVDGKSVEKEHMCYYINRVSHVEKESESFNGVPRIAKEGKNAKSNNKKKERVIEYFPYLSYDVETNGHLCMTTIVDVNIAEYRKKFSSIIDCSDCNS